MPTTRGKSKSNQYTPSSPTSDSENLDPWLSWTFAGTGNKAGNSTGQGSSSQPTSKDVPPPPGKVVKKRNKNGKKQPVKKQKQADLAWNLASFVPPVVITIPDPHTQGSQQTGAQQSTAANPAPVVPPAAAFVPTPVPAPVPPPTQTSGGHPPLVQNTPAANPPVFCGTPWLYDS